MINALATLDSCRQPVYSENVGIEVTPMTVTTFSTRTRAESVLRDELRVQIARLEADHATANARLNRPVDTTSTASTPRLLTASELESVRDQLVTRFLDTQAELRELDVEEARQHERRDLLRRMHDEPARHRWTTITTRDIGEPGCRRWEARPILGVIGLLSGWWRVRVSSGCP